MQDLFAATDIPWWDAGLRMLLACVCGAAIGWDREPRGRPAGLRTHMLVALGASGFALLAVSLVVEAGGSTGVDPARIISGIIGGIGFLGAGAIIQSGGDVRGLTTAAGLWLTAAIGAAMGVGAFGLGGMLTVLGFITIVVLRGFEDRVGRRGEPS